MIESVGALGVKNAVQFNHLQFSERVDHFLLTFQSIWSFSDEAILNSDLIKHWPYISFSLYMIPYYSINFELELHSIGKVSSHNGVEPCQQIPTSNFNPIAVSHCTGQGSV